MGSPLGVVFANAYMQETEEKTFRTHTKPRIYARYIDDIFIAIRRPEDAKNLANNLHKNSCLNYTIEKSKNKTLPFLDILVSQKENKFDTTVYTKPTNTGRCLNARGECPESFKRSVVEAYVKRAITHCSSWKEVHRELERTAQTLTNNGYSDCMIQDVIRNRLEKLYTDQKKDEEKNTKQEITIYHRISYHTQFENEKQATTNILKRGIVPIEPYKLKVQIYSKPNMTAQTIMKNNTMTRAEVESKSHVVYKFKCPEGTCEYPPKTYVGFTTTTLRQRFQAHRNQGSIHQHYIDQHDRKPTIKELIENTSIEYTNQNRYNLLIAEAIFITRTQPTLNIQKDTNMTLPSNRIITYETEPGGTGHVTNMPAPRQDHTTENLHNH